MFEIHFANSACEDSKIKQVLCFQLAGFVANVSAVTENDDGDKNVVDELMRMLSYDSLPMLELLLRTLSVLPGEVRYIHT